MRPSLAAIAYLARGWSVIPIGPDKRPLKPWKEYQDRRATDEEAVDWYQRWPEGNIGIVTGPISGISVVDLDGPDGEQSAKPLKLPRTYTVKTPKGWHLYYQYQPALHTGAAFLPGIDVRSAGGYVVAPPSTIEGKPYRALRVWDLAVLDAPDALLSHERRQTEPGMPPPRRDPSWVGEALRGVNERERNNTATQLAGYFHRKGLPASTIEAIMVPFAGACHPPMDLSELRITIESVVRYPGGMGLSVLDLRDDGFHP